jgi:hypothetical protein
MPVSDDPALWLYEFVEEGRTGELKVSPGSIEVVEGVLQTYAELLVDRLLADLSSASTG